MLEEDVSQRSKVKDSKKGYVPNIVWNRREVSLTVMTLSVATLRLSFSVTLLQYLVTHSVVFLSTIDG
jgi:hypothetical protein